MNRQMADDEVLRVLAMARVCVANYPSHDPMVHAGPMFDPAAAAAQFDAAVAALQAERDALRDRCAKLEAAHRDDDMVVVPLFLYDEINATSAANAAALEALRGQVAGLVGAAQKFRDAEYARNGTGERLDAFHDARDELDAALLAIKERMG